MIVDVTNDKKIVEDVIIKDIIAEDVIAEDVIAEDVIAEDVIAEVYVVFIVNKRFVRWEIFNTLSTLNDVFDVLKLKYDIKKCILEIGDVSIIQNRRFNNENLSKILIREKIGTIYVIAKNITYLNKETV